MCCQDTTVPRARPIPLISIAWCVLLARSVLWALTTRFPAHLVPIKMRGATTLARLVLLVSTVRITHLTRLCVPWAAIVPTAVVSRTSSCVLRARSATRPVSVALWIALLVCRVITARLRVLHLRRVLAQLGISAAVVLRWQLLTSRTRSISL